MFLSFVISLLTMVSINAQNLTKREVYQSLEMGQKQLIHKTISSYWDYSLYADTVEVHQFLGWLDTVTTPGVWVGEWAVFPCKKYSETSIKAMVAQFRMCSISSRVMPLMR